MAAHRQRLRTRGVAAPVLLLFAWPALAWAAPAKPAVKAPAATPAVVAPAATAAAAPSQAEGARGAQKEAAAEYAAGRFRKSAELFHTCFGLDATQFGCLFNAARSEQRDFQLDSAEATFRRFLDVAPQDHEGRRRATVHLDEIRDTRARLQAEKAAAAAVTIAVAPTETVEKPGSWLRPAGWGAAGAGVVLAAVGVAVLVRASGEQADLDAKVADRQNGKVSGIDYAAYAEQQADLNGRYYLGDALLGVGVACAGVGAWLLATTPALPAVTLAPQAGGVRASVAWRF